MEISLHVEEQGVRVPVNTFVSAIQKLLKLLHEVETTISPDNRVVLVWEISDLEFGSARMDAVATSSCPLPYSGDQVASIAVQGLRLIEEGDSRPPHFSDSAIQTAKDLCLITKTGKVTVRSKNNLIDLTPKLAANASRFLETAIEALGTVEGYLKMISTVTRNWRFHVYDSVTRLPVRCFVDEALLPTVAGAINRRVRITGVVSYSREGYPKSIRHISEFVVIPPDSDLPTVDDLLARDLDLAGGLSLEEYLEKKLND